MTAEDIDNSCKFLENLQELSKNPRLFNTYK